MMAREKLGDILKRKGLVSGAKLVTALDQQKLQGGRLGDILVGQGVITERDLVFALSEQSKIPVINFARAPVNPSAIKLINRNTALQLMVMPITFVAGSQGQSLVLAMESLPDETFLQDMQRLTGFPIRPMLSGRTQIISALAEAYRASV